MAATAADLVTGRNTKDRSCLTAQTKAKPCGTHTDMSLRVPLQWAAVRKKSLPRQKNAHKMEKREKLCETLHKDSRRAASTKASQSVTRIAGSGTTVYQCCTYSHSVQDCASFVSSSRNSNRTTTRSSPHARIPGIVDTSKDKSANWGKRAA